MGPSSRMWFLTYVKGDVCSDLELTDNQLTALGIICKPNDNWVSKSSKIWVETKEVAQGAQTKQQTAQKYRHFRTIDVPDIAMSHKFRKRYSYKEQYESGMEHPPPEIMSQYKWRLSKKPANQSDCQEPAEPVKMEPPKAMSEDSTAELIISCVQRAAHEASKVKRKCQEILGRYLKAISDSEVTKEDRVILEYLCPHDDDDDDTVDCANNADSDDGPADKHKTRAFIYSLMAFLYSRNMSSKKNGIGPIVNQFIERLQELCLLPKPETDDYLKLKNKMEFTPNFLVRSVAIQFAAALKRHWKVGCKEGKSCSILMQQQQKGLWSKDF
ncbi:hypothetical protein BGW38_004518 [Lunasporangiospora selenospora]|uniref:Uncharacterized protein n=1 Tax=Lunasporangiospora selenospora TaxID=979761 RepID=A0A9P6KHB2_9FUNG|nr:hypothetical protein BGW38_004518 [Lunasporangiospora selenospora]